VSPFSVANGRTLTARVGAWARGHRRRVGIGAGVLLALAVYPWAVGGLAANLFATRVSERLGRAVTVGKGRAGFGQVTLTDIRVAGTVGPPLLAVDRMVVPFGAAVGGRGPILVSGARAHVVRGGTDDNVTSILDRLHRRGPTTGVGEKAGGATPPGLVIEGATLDARDRGSGLSVTIKSLDGQLIPGETLKLRAGGVAGLLALTGDDQGPRFGAEEVGVLAALTGLRPIGFPGLRVKGGFATPLPTLSLTGITGVIAPPASSATAPAPGPGTGAMTIDLHGSYGGAREALWTAKGHADLEQREGALSLRAEQFSLDKIADVLPRSVLTPANTSMDAAFDVSWVAGVVKFGGDLAVVGVSLQHDALAAEAVENVSLGLAIRGTASLVERRLELERLEARVRDLTARLSGTIELPRGTFKFANGRKLGVVPKVDLTLVVPRLPCAKLLDSIPSALTPRLQGFVLKGVFEAQVGAKIDFANLEALDLHGKVGIDGCKVVKAPEGVLALAGTQSIVVNVEVPPRPGPGAAAGETETLAVVVGPQNPDFVPYDQISPYLINSIMTTEDNGFFKHRGWVTSQFKSALRRNLLRGGFRLGASSITMQMVKNVLLSQEKTLSRKLQELFLVWYLEQELPKERILELYFNAIEFGPRLYGIGAAARHYFGKKPADLTPLEAAFFSSILPSPKRRYVQYCHGAPLPAWDKYLHRILAKVHERGRLTDDEYAQWAAQPLVFDRKEATFSEKQCLDWVRTMTARPEADVPPELDEDADDGGNAFSARKLRRLFAHGSRRGGAVPPKGGRAR
jgi:Transglycosylase